MKRHAFVIAGMLGLLLLPALSAQAQMMKVIVPFDFSTGQATLPAGDYNVSKHSTAQGVLQIRSNDGSAAAFLLTSSVQARQIGEKGKLVFNRYGNQYFLTQVWEPGNDTGHQLRQSKAEREIARNAAKPKLEILTASK